MASVSKSVQNSEELIGVSFLKLREGMCKFPLGTIREAVTRFCGEPASVGVPYCDKCRVMAYTNSKRPK